MKLIAVEKKRRIAGFGLIEILLVVVVLSIFAAVVIPRLSKLDLYGKYQVYTTAHKVSAALRLARRLAITTGDDHRVIFSKTGGSGDYNEYRIQQRVGGIWVMVGEVKSMLDAIKVSGDSDAIFSPDGSAVRDRSFTYKDSANGNRHRLDVKKITGRVRLRTN